MSEEKQVIVWFHVQECRNDEEHEGIKSYRFSSYEEAEMFINNMGLSGYIYSIDKIYEVK